MEQQDGSLRQVAGENLTKPQRTGQSDSRLSADFLVTRWVFNHADRSRLSRQLRRETLLSSAHASSRRINHVDDESRQAAACHGVLMRVETTACLEPSGRLGDLKSQARPVLRRARTRLYPGSNLRPLTHSNPYQLLVATILSAQCTNARVNMVTPGAIPPVSRPTQSGESQAGPGRGPHSLDRFFRAKARSLLAMAQQIVELHRRQDSS